MNTAKFGKQLFRYVVLSSALISAPSLLASVQPTTARSQLHTAVTNAASAEIRQRASQFGWRDYSSKLHIYMPGDASRLPRCSHPLNVIQPAGTSRELTRLRYDLRCESPMEWELSVTVKADVVMPVVVARQAVERGTALEGALVVLKKRNISHLQQRFFTEIDRVNGLSTRRRLRESQVIAPADIEQPVMVERGQQVTVIAQLSSSEVRMVGEAQKRGRKDEVISIKNLTSQRLFSARVTGPATVELLTPP